MSFVIVRHVIVNFATIAFNLLIFFNLKQSSRKRFLNKIKLRKICPSFEIKIFVMYLC